jgi:hypothetical protein
MSAVNGNIQLWDWHRYFVSVLAVSSQFLSTSIDVEILAGADCSLEFGS